MICLAHSVPVRNVDITQLHHASTTYQNFVAPVTIQGPSNKLDNTIEPHGEVGGGGILDWDVHDQDSSVERPAHVFFHRRYDVRDTEAVEISGYASSKDI